MRGFFKAMMVAALAVVRRFVTRQPNGEYERIAFEAVYQAGRYARRSLA